MSIELRKRRLRQARDGLRRKRQGAESDFGRRGNSCELCGTCDSTRKQERDPLEVTLLSLTQSPPERARYYSQCVAHGLLLPSRLRVCVSVHQFSSFAFYPTSSRDTTGIFWTCVQGVANSCMECDWISNSYCSHTKASFNKKAWKKGSLGF